MKRMTLDEFIPDFRDRARKSPWVLWVGSAVSCQAPTSIPMTVPIVRGLTAFLADDDSDKSASKLLRRARREFGDGGSLDLMQRGTPRHPEEGWRMPFEAIMGEVSNHTDEFIERFLTALAPAGKAAIPNANHEAIYQLATNELVNPVFTTNFDECIDVGWQGTTLVPVSANGWRSHAGGVSLIKLHGTISDYATVAANPGALAERARLNWQTELVDLLRGRNVLFVGYGFQDRFDITPALNGALKSDARFYWANHEFPPRLPFPAMTLIETDLRYPDENILLRLAPRQTASPGVWPTNEEQQSAAGAALHRARTERDPTRAERLKAFAALYYWLEDGRRALQLFKRAKREHPASVDTHTLARASLRARRYRRAVSLFDRMLKSELPTTQPDRIHAAVDWHCGAAHCAAAGGRVLLGEAHYKAAATDLADADMQPMNLNPYLMDQFLRGRAGNATRLAIMSWKESRAEYLLRAERHLHELSQDSERLELRVRYLIRRDLARIEIIRGNSREAVGELTEVRDFFAFWGDPDGLSTAIRDLASASKLGRFRTLGASAIEARERGRWLEWLKIEATRLGLSGYGPLSPLQYRLRSLIIATWDAAKELTMSVGERLSRDDF